MKSNTIENKNNQRKFRLNHEFKTKSTKLFQVTSVNLNR